MKIPTRKEELMMLAILQLAGDASLVRLREFLNKSTDKSWSVGNTFVTLDKLEEKGWISSTLGKPKSVKGGRAVRFYLITSTGMAQLRSIRKLQNTLWEGVERIVFHE